MAVEDNRMFSTGSLQTFIAASFVIALLALGMSIYNYTRTTHAVAALLDLQGEAPTAQEDTTSTADLQARLAELEAKVQAMEEAAAQTAAATEGAPE